MVKKSTLFARTFFNEISMSKNSTWRRFPFVNNFKKLTFARLFSLNFSSKSLWCSAVPLKFESYNLQPCKENCCKLVFFGIYRTTALPQSKLNSNQPIKVAHLQKLAKQSILNGALMIEMVNNSFSGSKKNFGRLKKQGTF